MCLEECSYWAAAGLTEMVDEKLLLSGAGLLSRVESDSFLLCVEISRTVSLFVCSGTGDLLWKRGSLGSATRNRDLLIIGTFFCMIRYDAAAYLLSLLVGGSGYFF